MQYPQEQVWERARLKKKQLNVPEFLLLIDEIQKISNWSETVKKLWDEDTFNGVGLKVVLLGSSRLLLQKGLTESLAGRFETLYIGHWTFNEMNNAFGWDEEKFVWFGGYPGSESLVKDEPRWKKYIKDSLIETSISKDILMLSRVDKPALMKHLFELGCLYSGQIPSLSKIQGQLQDAGNTTTLSHYLNLLDTAGLITGLEKIAADDIQKRSSSPKFQVHNNALLSSQMNDMFQKILPEKDKWGRVIESGIGAHLLNHSLTHDFKLYYWRERNNEVDFIVEHKGKRLAIEVKSGTISNYKGMLSFIQKYAPDKTISLSNKGIPWKEFLKINPLEIF